MKKIIILMLAITIVGLISGCVEVPDASSVLKGNTSGGVEVPDTSPILEWDISFRIEERFTEHFDGPHLFLVVSTKEIYPCANYGFGHTLRIEDDLIKIILGEITSPSMCLTAEGPAIFEEDLDLITTENKLEFHSKDKIDIYTMKISNESVVIEPVDATFSKIEKTAFKRIPENLLFAQCFYNGNWMYDPKDDFCTRYFDEIETIAHPYLIGEEGKTPENQFYLYGGDDQEIIDIVNKYSGGNFYVRISTWKGKTFICPYNCEKPGIAYVPELKIEYSRDARTNVTLCGKDVVCIMEVAFNTKNETICELLPEKNRGQCFGQVGIAKLDESLCDKTGSCFTCQQECYSYIASKKI